MIAPVLPDCTCHLPYGSIVDDGTVVRCDVFYLPGMRKESCAQFRLGHSRRRLDPTFLRDQTVETHQPSVIIMDPLFTIQLMSRTF